MNYANRTTVRSSRPNWSRQRWIGTSSSFRQAPSISSRSWRPGFATVIRSWTNGLWVVDCYPDTRLSFTVHRVLERQSPPLCWVSGWVRTFTESLCSEFRRTNRRWGRVPRARALRSLRRRSQEPRGCQRASRRRRLALVQEEEGSPAGSERENERSSRRQTSPN